MIRDGEPSVLTAHFRPFATRGPTLTGNTLTEPLGTLSMACRTKTENGRLPGGQYPVPGTARDDRLLVLAGVYGIPERRDGVINRQGHLP